MMIRYPNERSNPRLPRSKSTSSVNRDVHLDHLDALAADRDAHVAATISYYRAGQYGHELEMEEIGRRGGSRPSSRNANIRRGSVWSRSGAADLCQEQSIRFSGQRPMPRRNSESGIGMAPPALERGRSQSKAHWSMQNEPLDQPPLDHRPSSSLNSRTANYLHAMQASEEYYTPEDNIASAPSSYRKLRKTRSMVAPPSMRPAANHYYFNNGTPKSHHFRTASNAHQLFLSNKENAISVDDEPVLRVPKSISFLKHRSDIGPYRRNSRQENDLAVQLAKEKFLEQVQHQQFLASRSGSLLRAKHKRNSSSFAMRRSLRNSSSSLSHDNLAVPEQSTTASHDPPVYNKGRKVSAGLRTRIKKLLHLSKKEYTGSFRSEGDSPVEDYLAPEAVGDLDQDRAIIGPEGGSPTSPVQPQMPLIRPVSSDEQPRPSRGSRKGERADQMEKAQEVPAPAPVPAPVPAQARPSSGGRSIIGHGTSDEWEKQRLSIIKENGVHISSTSLRRIPGYERTRCNSIQEQQEFGVPGNPHLSQGPVDVQRLYSTLLKRQEQQKMDRDRRRQSLQDFKKNGTVPTRDGSTAPEADTRTSGLLAPRDESPITIRCVQKQDDDVFQDLPRPQHTPENPRKPMIVKGTRMRTLSSSSSSPSFYGSVGRRRKNISPSQRAKYRLERCKANQISARSSPLSGESHDKPTNIRSADTSQKSSISIPSISPANVEHVQGPANRKFGALNADPPVVQKEFGWPNNLGGDKATPIPDHLPSLSNISLPIRQPSSSPGSGYQNTQTESVYFSDSSTLHRKRHTRTHTQGSISPEVKSTNGSERARSEEPTTYQPTLPTDRKVSDSSSVEWKRTLSTNVSRLEQSPLRGNPNPFRTVVTCAMPTMPKQHGHIREQADIGDTSLGGTKSPETYEPTGRGVVVRTTTIGIGGQVPLKLSERKIMPYTANSSRPIQPPKLTPLKIPNDENGRPAAPANPDSACSIEGSPTSPPPIPQKSVLRQPPSMPNMRSARTYETVPGVWEVKTPSSERRPKAVVEMKSFLTLRNTTPSMPSLAHTPKEITTKGSTTKRQTVKLVKRPPQKKVTAALSPASSTSTPLLSAAFEKHFGADRWASSATAGSPQVREIRPKPTPKAPQTPLYHGSGYAYDGPREKLSPEEPGVTQITGSRRMVDLFLSSRRQRIAGSDDTTVFI